MKGTYRLMAAGVLAFAASAAQADDTFKLRPYFNFGPSVTFADDDERHSDNGLGYYAGVGFPIHRYFGLEANIYQSWFDREDAPDNLKWDERGAEANLMFTYPLTNGWVPYVSVGGGIVESDLSGASDSRDPALTYGGGVFSYTKVGQRDLGLRLDVRFRELEVDDADIGGGFVSDEFRELVVRLGLVFPFGKPLGWTDDAAKGKGTDSDGDGVADSSDLCPDSPKGTKVDAKGCPVSSEVGSPAVDKGRYGPVYFDFDKSDIKASEASKLDAAVAATAKMERPKIVLKLDGHTDSMGTTEYNQGLGERRANAVKQYLQSKGIKATDIVVTSYGEVRPAASNDSEEGRSLNRRVEIIVTED